MEQDIFDTDRPTPERSFRYPLYERFLWIVVVAALVAGLIGYSYIKDFVELDPARGAAALGIVGVFLVIIIMISVRAWMSRVIISPTSLKCKSFGQGYQRISWTHVQKVLYKWRPLGHKLVFVGSDGAKVSFRSAISDYDLLLSFIRENVPESVADQLDDLFGDEEEREEAEEEEEKEEDEDKEKHKE